jgi:hypothetical protein
LRINEKVVLQKPCTTFLLSLIICPKTSKTLRC